MPRPLSTPVRRFWAAATVVLTIAAGTAGCSGDDASGPPDTVDSIQPLPTAPPISSLVDDSPFCRAMLDLGAGDQDSDDGPGIAEVFEVYVDVRDEVPPEIRPEFDVVVDHLRTLVDGGEAADPTAVEESTIALAAYVELRCRGTAMSPLPPPTTPGGDDSAD